MCIFVYDGFLLACYFILSKKIDYDSDAILQLNKTAYRNILNSNVFLSLVLINFYCSIVCAVFSSLGLSLSFFIKNKIVAWTSPVIITIFMALFAYFLNITKFEPLAMLDIFRVSKISSLFKIIYLSTILFLSYFFGYYKFSMDVKNDEEF